MRKPFVVRPERFRGIAEGRITAQVISGSYVSHIPGDTMIFISGRGKEEGVTVVVETTIICHYRFLQEEHFDMLGITPNDFTKLFGEMVPTYLFTFIIFKRQEA